ncbi:MAG: cytochrome-c peroxidase [Flavobacteriales bacterium]|nr:cytochrome-c peroxidase [Flavobacteriales bacterium]
MLFYNVAFSNDSSISCAGCHKPELAFADNVAFSKGAFNRLGTRNTPSLGNVALHPYFTREGGVASLETQVLVPIQEHNEFDFNILEIVERLKRDTLIANMGFEAYNRPFDYYVLVRALATFERGLLSSNSDFDRNELTENQKAGMELFFSDKTNCSKCHSGFNFTNYAFANNGLYEKYADLGRKRLTGLQSDEALFKVASLRNVAITAPYMHDGSLPDLPSVINHYNSGGKPHENKSDLIKPLHLNETEKNQLVDFLKSLTDNQFLANTTFRLQ